ncbi:MAG: ATP-binding cassette domain-containing protein [Propionibacteriaceae bacterium]|nr:ATP-binding cassette domain-containing protein [Propionibacteriaceae bacterium]
MIELYGVTKTFGSTVAVNDLSIVVQPGRVTGFLGPNGAGKSTTMRLIMGLNHPTSGTILVNHRRLGESPAPLCEIGAVLDARAMQPNRTARQHMQILAVTHGIPAARVDELLAVTGLAEVAHMRIGSYSLGMSQRLAIATALLGDPQVLIFDEPINGLDPEGVAWVRALLRQQAGAGKTVLVSSHLMSEMEHTADQLLIVGRGRLLADIGMADFIAGASGVACRLTSPDAPAIVAAFAGPGVQAVPLHPDTIELRGVDVKQVAERAARSGWIIYQLAPVEVSLEDAYLQLTAGAVDYVSGGTTVSAGYAANGPAWRPSAPAQTYQAPPAWQQPDTYAPPPPPPDGSNPTGGPR